jgi:hypothetical protein
MKRTVTLDTSVLPAADLLEAAGDQFDFAYISVTGREMEGTSFSVELIPLSEVPETMVWDESRWGEGVWATEPSQFNLDRILHIVSAGSFPGFGHILTKRQRAQLRDAMIFEAHVRAKRDILVTDDQRAFIKGSRRIRLESEFNTKVLTRQEFIDSYKSLKREVFR